MHGDIFDISCCSTTDNPCSSWQNLHEKTYQFDWCLTQKQYHCRKTTPSAIKTCGLSRQAASSDRLTLFVLYREHTALGSYRDRVIQGMDHTGLGPYRSWTIQAWGSHRDWIMHYFSPKTTCLQRPDFYGWLASLSRGTVISHTKYNIPSIVIL